MIRKANGKNLRMTANAEVGTLASVKKPLSTALAVPEPACVAFVPTNDLRYA